MENRQIGEILQSFTDLYYSLPWAYVREKLLEWHPEITDEQLQEVLDETDESVFHYHCCVVDEDLPEPELAAEHMVCFWDEYEMFLQARRDDLPLKDIPEKDLLELLKSSVIARTPELESLERFGREVLRLDRQWVDELTHICLFSQIGALCHDESWLEHFLRNSRWGKIHFENLTQLRAFRRLANAFYLTQPNPVLKGWRPCDIPNAPVPHDDLPTEEDLLELQDRSALDRLQETFNKKLHPHSASKPGRNDPCPCGSGKKYKNCCGKK